MVFPKKNRAIIVISLVIIIFDIIVIGGWLFDIPVVQNLVYGFLSMNFNAVLFVVLFGTALFFIQNRLMSNNLEKIIKERSADFHKSEEKYHSLIEHASDAIYVLDFKRTFTDVNESMCKMTGYTREELLQLKVEAIIDPDELKIDPLPDTMDTSGQSIVRERKFMRKNGQRFTVEINVKKFTDNLILVIARDVSDRKKMEAGLKEAELKFRTIAEKSMVGVYIVQDGKFIYVNPRFAEVFGYEPDELVGTVSVETIIHETYRTIVTENVRRRMEGEVESINYEALGRKKDGSPHWIEFYGSRAMIDGVPTIIGSMIDINERKNAEGLILKEKELSDTIINSLPGVFYLQNDKGEYLRWNKNFETVSGYTAEEIKHISFMNLIVDEDQEIVVKAIQKVFAEGYIMVEAKARTKGGVIIPFLLTGSPVMYENQRCLLGTGIDISQRIKAEEELKSSEHKYKLLFESNPSPMWMIARDDLSVIAYNNAAAKLYGYTKDELLNKSATIFRPAEDHEKQRERYKTDMDDSDLAIARHLKKDGTIISVQIIAHDIIFEGRSVRLSLTNDITERLKAEESLQKSEANLQTILKTTNTAYLLFDLDLKMLAFNQSAIHFITDQYHHEPAKGDHFSDYFPPGRFPQFIDFADEVLNGNSVNNEVDYMKEDGSIFWYYIRLAPITNDNKEILGMMMALYDITERKNAEQDLKTAYGRIQTHMDNIKDMAWKQSHLIRSPLANLKGLFTMLRDAPADTEVFDHIESELHRMDTIIIEMAEDASDHEIMP